MRDPARPAFRDDADRSQKHIHILEDAELVTTEKIGRSRECRLGPRRLEDATRWIETHRRRWERRLDRFEHYLEKSRGGR